MIILRVIPSMDPIQGGPCQGIRNSVPELARQGILSEVVCLDCPSSSYLADEPLKIHAVGPAKGPWVHSKLLLPWLLENLPKYDAVVVHGLWLYHGYAVRKALRILRNRGSHPKLPDYHVMPHGMLDPYFQRDPSRRVKALRNFVYWKIIEKKVVNEARSLLFTCEEEMRLAREPFRPYAPQLEVNVGYGVAPPPPATEGMKEAFRATCPGLVDRPYLLFLSRIHPKKGVDLLIRAYCEIVSAAASELRSRLPALVIAGPVDSSYGHEMQELAMKLLPGGAADGPGADSPSIHFPGMLRGDAKWGAFHGCEAFVLPSHQENFGIAVVESLACGKPVLISDRVNIWREIKDEGAGIISADNLEETRAALLRWLELPLQEQTRMAEGALQCYTRHFRIDAAAARFAEAFQRS